MYPTLLDTETGESKVCPELESPMSWWIDGNGSCDCNRAIAMGKDEELCEAMHQAHPDLLSYQGYCYGEKRFLVVALHGDLEGYDLDTALNFVNDCYPEELKQHWLRDISR